jgi:preprotein translocase subunit SecD
MKKPIRLFVIILLLTFVALYIDIPSTFPININLGPLKIQHTIERLPIKINLGPFRIFRDLEIRQGLDLKGGSHLLFEADMTGIPDSDRENAINSSKEIISRRVDLYGVTEPLIQSSINNGNYRIIVELPGVSDTKEAIALIGQTAQLDFREEPPKEWLESEEASPSEDTVASIISYTPTDLTGKDLTKAEVQFDQSRGGSPVVGLQFTSDGKNKFAEITKRNIGKRLAIFLDDMLLTAPIVNQAITNGDAIISGDFSIEEARSLAIQLNAGALPVPVKVIEERTVGATLGQDSVYKSIRAGVIGLSIVIAFMALYYGWLGIIADMALVVYGLLTLAIYKLIPITLTLPGLAGFVLSVGMAVDSNILIFERMKEEQRRGKAWQVAMELGFGRAWDSIKDANVATLITTFVLLNPFEWSLLPTSGMARGFAITLGLGVLISLFTGIMVTRTFLRVLYSKKDNLQNSK